MKNIILFYNLCSAEFWDKHKIAAVIIIAVIGMAVVVFNYFKRKEFKIMEEQLRRLNEEFESSNKVLVKTADNVSKLIWFPDYDDLFKSAKEAEKFYTEALEKYRKLKKTGPGVYSPDVAGTLYNLANMQRIQNRKADAEKNYKEALEIYRKLARTNPEVYSSDVAGTLYNLANLQRKQNRYYEAGKNYMKALEIFRELEKTNPEVCLLYVARTLINFANSYIFSENKPEANKCVTKVLEILEPIEHKTTYIQGYYEESLEIKERLDSMPD